MAKAVCGVGHGHLIIVSYVPSGFGYFGQVKMEPACNFVRSRYYDRLKGGKTRNEDYGFGSDGLSPPPSSNGLLDVHE